jgi:gluconolactonase
MDIIAEELRFPEGPIAMDDGSVIVVEIARGTLSRVTAAGDIEVIAELRSGPNGAAIGPDGHCYVCNNGGMIFHESSAGLLYPGGQPEDYIGGQIQRVDIDTGAFETLYDSCNGIGLRGPNDIVFDADGGLWFTDHGKIRDRERDVTGVFYAKADGTFIEEAIFPLEGPNGIGRSPDEKTLYVAETVPGRTWAFDSAEPGKIDPRSKRMLALMPDYHLFDSLAIDAEGNVCVATIINGGITVHSPAGDAVKHVPMPDRITTNICFGGKHLKTAYITLSTTGKLAAMEWETPGLALNFLNK